METIKTMIVVSKSRAMRRTSKRTGHEYEVRYLTCEDVENPTIAYKLSIYPRGDTWPPIYTYSKISVPIRSTSPAKVDDRYDKNLDGIPFLTAFWVNGFKQHEIQVNGYYTVTTTITIPMERCEIFSDHIEADHISIPAQDLGFTHFPHVVREVEWTGDISLLGRFEWHLAPVYNRATGQREFRRINKYVDGSIDISGSNLGMLEQVVRTADDNARLQEIIADIQARLAKGEYISPGQVEEILTMAELYGVDPEEVLRGQTLRGEYEPIFFEILRDEHDEEKEIFFGTCGFIFSIDGKWVWEEPKYGAATYIFDPLLEGRDLAVMLSELSRIDILHDAGIQAVTGFVRRVIHPKDASVESYISRWMSEILA